MLGEGQLPEFIVWHSRYRTKSQKSDENPDPHYKS